MAKDETRTGQAEKMALPNFIPPELAAVGQKRMEDFVAMQTELFESLMESNRKWLDRLQSQTTLISELGTKLAAARTIPETAGSIRESAPAGTWKWPPKTPSASSTRVRNWWKRAHSYCPAGGNLTVTTEVPRKRK